MTTENQIAPDYTDASVLKVGDTVKYYHPDTHQIIDYTVAEVYTHGPDKHHPQLDGKAYYYRLASPEVKSSITGTELMVGAGAWELRQAWYAALKPQRQFRVRGRGVNYEVVDFNRVLWAEDEEDAVEALREIITDNCDNVDGSDDGTPWAEDITPDEEDWPENE